MDELVALLLGVHVDDIHLVAQIQREHIGDAVAHPHGTAVFLHDFLMTVFVGVAVPAPGVNAEIMGAVQVLVAHLVVADHIRPDLVAVHAVGVVDQVRGIAARGAHVDFQGHIIALFAQSLLAGVQAEKLAVEKAAFGAEGLDGAESHIPQRFGHIFLGPVGQILHRVHNVNHRDGEDVGGVEQRHAVAVCHAVKADDGAVNEFLHDVLHRRQIGVKRFQLRIVFELVGGLCAAAVVRLHNDGVAHFLHKGFGAGQIADHVMPRHGHTGRNVAFLHFALELDAVNKIILGAGVDVEVGAQGRILLQPVFVVAFQPVDLAVPHGKVPHGADHGIVVAHVVHPVILGQAGFELVGDLVIGRIPDAQHIHAVALEAVTEIPVSFGELGGHKNKVHVQHPLSFSKAGQTN